MNSLLALELPELKILLQERGYSAFVGEQIFQWVYKHLVFDPAQWTNVKQQLREEMASFLDLRVPAIIREQVSQDGTRKFLLQFSDQDTVESVLIPRNGRLAICLSSQVGCAFGCRFCHTATQGLKRNLTAAEIVGQFLAVQKHLLTIDPSWGLTNIVFMGQGEPLHNFAAVKKAILILMDNHGIGMGQRRITVSTCGFLAGMKKLDDFPPVNIAISLHSARDEIRDQLMPVNHREGLKGLAEAIRAIPLKAHRRITYEYLLIRDLNDTPADIQALAKFLDPHKAKINLIPFNEYPTSHFARPTPEKVAWFQEELMKHNFVCTIRPSMGPDILAACGQLKSAELKKEEALPLAGKSS
jgi:23S rRNA (adenine2503-C2)-methyltransferase